MVRPPGEGTTASGPALRLSLTEEPWGPGSTWWGFFHREPAHHGAVGGGNTGLPFIAPGSEVFRIGLLELQSGNPAKNVPLGSGDTVNFPKAAQMYGWAAWRGRGPTATRKA